MRFKMAAAALLALTLVRPGPPARAADTYAIDQRFGDIAFKVRHLGLFSSEGTFRRFTGQLTIDESHPEKTRIAVVIETRSVAMNWAAATDMLRSPSYFDVAQYPAARFTSTRVMPTGASSYEIDGLLQIRGVTQPMVLHAALVGRHAAAKPGAEIADFVVTGLLRRSLFGMTSNQDFISDRVDLRIDARVMLDAAAHDG